MNQISVVAGFTGQPYFQRLLEFFAVLPAVSNILVVTRETPRLPGKCEIIEGKTPFSGKILDRILETIDTPLLLFLDAARDISPGPYCLERFMEVAITVKAGMVYSDYYESTGEGLREHPLIDYQLGSIRDDFDFGSLTLFSTAAARHSLMKFGKIAPDLEMGLYDLRLKVSLEERIFHIEEYLYTVCPSAGKGGRSATHFSYLDPCNRKLQKEMEDIATAHLKRIGAFLEPAFENIPPPGRTYPVEASIVIPVRNRAGTIADAVHSALAQKADFPFNVLVIDNHSDDGTTLRLNEMSKDHPRLRHIIPVRRDLNIGGCWNEAVFSPYCGLYAVQLDSDDLYSSSHSLERLVELLRTGRYGMAVGSYTVVDEGLEEIPPGLIDHGEWTETNGRNNALRINGLGAPRAFHTELLRMFRFPNVSYGEDYAMALRIMREYRTGRIYDSLYLCRRWKGNTDAALSIAQGNRHDSFKDKIRSIEIMARQELNRRKTAVASRQL